MFTQSDYALLAKAYELIRRLISAANGERNAPLYDYKGVRRHYRFDKLHREGDLPAVEGDEFKAWYIDGKLHREGGKPAIDATGLRAWYQAGLPYREDGKPFIERTDGSKEWVIPDTDPALKRYDKNYVTTFLQMPGVTEGRLVLSPDKVPTHVLAEVKRTLKAEESKLRQEWAKTRKTPTRLTNEEKAQKLEAEKATRRRRR